jgi:uroporphyrinogen III methyltransferase/synthase
VDATFPGTDQSPTIQRNVLLAPAASELATALKEVGLHVMTWPQFHVAAPESFAALDEAIDNLFGYDWIVFVNDDAVGCFLDRFLRLGHEISELDSPRVCAIGEATLAALEHRQVHVDVTPPQLKPTHVVESIVGYVGGAQPLDRLTFLIPQATIGRYYLKPHFEGTGARTDLVAAYQTVRRDDAMRLVSLQAVLLTGGIDAVVFTQVSDVSDFARVLDTSDLSRLLAEVAVMCLDNETSAHAVQLGASPTIFSGAASAKDAADAIAAHFSR